MVDRIFVQSIPGQSFHVVAEVSEGGASFGRTFKVTVSVDGVSCGACRRRYTCPAAIVVGNCFSFDVLRYHVFCWSQEPPRCSPRLQMQSTFQRVHVRQAPTRCAPPMLHHYIALCCASPSYKQQHSHPVSSLPAPPQANRTQSRLTPPSPAPSVWPSPRCTCAPKCPLKTLAAASLMSSTRSLSLKQAFALRSALACRGSPAGPHLDPLIYYCEPLTRLQNEMAI